MKSEETIAFVGTSGGGKSTLTRLLMKYYDVWKGGIEIDGVNIKDLSNKDLREIIGLVPQEPVLFNRSVYYNVGYALDDIHDLDNLGNKEIIIEACKKAKIHDFIMTLKDGYETKVGERGLKLSGGQKQRIAIARVLIKNPKVVIFDEATSMLDSESEKLIQEAFTVLSQNKTVIIIAHRLSTITHCDNIFVIENGSVAESGTHKELLSDSKIYKNLWDIQSGGFSKK
ncbi:MAG: ATP-binding cassette domain-containing protein [Candidatus Dojkabacteria bacterium]|nr:ATP-binding cassette domain-containing protein [Candidatus Dojkabacteria bacterium]MDQ7020361.1 ATP-binding cassette domain-containing protein [Candidatus Dojkabacteria bacterium]